MIPERRVGELLADKYRLEALLGVGGMGYVYRASNEQVGRQVAIKLLREEHAQNDVIVERFLREARTANLVRHANVVDVLDMGKDATGAPFLVQELLEGEDLAKHLESRGGRLKLDDAIEILCPIIDAVAEAHARGVVHRDIKPENVFLARTGNRRVPKLLDFGISKVRSAGVRATEAGVMLGTPAYMPPEQVNGSREVDARSDVWALGIMLFEVLAGRLPFDHAEAPALFVAIATGSAPRLVDVAPDVLPTVSRIVERCLRRKPDDRYPTAAELARDLRHLREGAEVEPTLRRSLPPSAAALVPELEIPPPPPTPRRLGASGGPIESAPGQEARDERRAPPPATVGGDGPLPPNDAHEPAVLAEAGARARPAPRPPMPGLLIAPSSDSALRGGAAAHAHPRTGTRAQAASAGDDAASSVLAWCAVGTTSLVALGLLMAVAHRPEGWPIARFLISATGTANTASQAILALAATLVGAGQVRRGVQQWRGDAAGGIAGALVTAGLAAAAFFCAVELARAG